VLALNRLRVAATCGDLISSSTAYTDLACEANAKLPMTLGDRIGEHPRDSYDGKHQPSQGKNFEAARS
jgi:hypothetical protein